MKPLSLENKILKSLRFFIVLFFWTLFSFGQSATVSGIVLDENQQPLSNVNISSGNSGTTTDQNGFYLLQLIADKKNTITFSHIGHENVVLQNLILTTNEAFEFNPVMKTDVVQMDEVQISSEGKKRFDGITTINRDVVLKIPSANAGVETLLKLLPGVSFNNELSTQYNVRGGNFDENLVYINNIQVYRPFLVRSAQQEGFSFVNSNMVQNVSFSAGGFQAKYGDKLSSVLDITYKTPTEFGLQIDASLLGASTTLETVSKTKKLSSITGVRYRNNSLLVNSLQTQSILQPVFFDAQSYINFFVSDKLDLSFLGNFSINDYQNEPRSRETNFGTILEPRALLIAYEGNEENRYQTELAAINADFHPNETTSLNFTTSVYHTTEEEFSDVIAQYQLGEVDTNLGSDTFGDIVNAGNVGGQINRTRNELDMLILNLSHQGVIKKGKSSLQWGVRYTYEDVRDALRESEFLDSVGFFVRPNEPEFINNQPEEPFLGDIVPFESVRASNFIITNRVSGFLQYDKKTLWGKHNVYYNLGVRAQSWQISNETSDGKRQLIVSPRVQIAVKPDWQEDMLFRLAIGSYQQPPLYRELRDLTGVANLEVEAQKSIHFVLGNEYSFTLWDRPFRLTSEAYYKKLTQVNTYTLEDIRIRYRANNNAEAYAYGFDFRLNGSLLPGEESWFSLGYLQTKENQDDRGYISRPTDQRLKFGLLFQDHMPTIPNLKLYVNLVYNTGVPGGSPNNADPYNFQNRLRDYRRADLGISYIFADENNRYPRDHWLSKLKAFNVGFEIFNLFNNQNSITNTWVRDVETQRQFAVPNFLTSRVLNLKFSMRF